MAPDKEPQSPAMIPVRPQDLPLACPQDPKAVWNSHPRVYLPIESTGQATCPYCGTRYKLHSA